MFVGVGLKPEIIKTDQPLSALLLLMCFISAESSLHSTFKYFERLAPSHIRQHRKRRDTKSQNVGDILVSFTAFQTRFSMVLSPGSDLLHPEAEVKLVDGQGRVTPRPIDRDKFYSGTVNRNPKSEVDAAEIGGAWIIHIHSPDEFYAVEPMWFYDSQVQHNDMVVYRSRDVRTDNTTKSKSMCGHQNTDSDSEALDHKDKTFKTKSYNVWNENKTPLKNNKRHLKHRLLSKHRRLFHRGTSYGIRAFGRKVQSKHVYTNSISLKSEDPNSSHSKTIIRHRDSSQKIPELDVATPNSSHSKTIIHHRDLNQKTLELDVTSPSKRADPPQRRIRASSAYKPESGRRTECDILVVGDYNIYKGIGRKSVLNLVATFVSIYKLVNKIYRKTTFGELGSGYGLRVKGILIHTAYGGGGYNAPDEKQPPRKILYHMHQVSTFRDYCLVHLSMERDMGNSHGFAAIGEPGKPWSTGICATRGDDHSWNLGLSTIKEASGAIISVALYSIVVAHEIGHNWGASHDPNHDLDMNYQCSPAMSRGGKYIMHSFSPRKIVPNSIKFSPCSIRMMTEVLRSRAHGCFLTKTAEEEICGNGILEPHEDCDPGFEYSDPCCTKTCRLVKGGACTPFHEPCCTKRCQIAPPTQQCLPIGRSYLECGLPSYCTGNSSSYCPQPRVAPDGTPCGILSRCHYGRCATACEQMGMKMSPPRDFRPCECDTDRRSMCRHCCYDTSGMNGMINCKIMGGYAEDGERCLMGLCQNQTCVDAPRDDDILEVGEVLLKMNKVARSSSPAFMCTAVTLWVSLVFNGFLLDRVK